MFFLMAGLSGSFANCSKPCSGTCCRSPGRHDTVAGMSLVRLGGALTLGSCATVTPGSRVEPQCHRKVTGRQRIGGIFSRERVYRNEIRCKVQTRTHLRRYAICREIVRLHFAIRTEKSMQISVPDGPHKCPPSLEQSTCLHRTLRSSIVAGNEGTVATVSIKAQWQWETHSMLPGK